MQSTTPRIPRCSAKHTFIWEDNTVTVQCGSPCEKLDAVVIKTCRNYKLGVYRLVSRTCAQCVSTPETKGEDLGPECAFPPCTNRTERPEFDTNGKPITGYFSWCAGHFDMCDEDLPAYMHGLTDAPGFTSCDFDYPIDSLINDNLQCLHRPYSKMCLRHARSVVDNCNECLHKWAFGGRAFVEKCPHK
jgi:hypothetical protein